MVTFEEIMTVCEERGMGTIIRNCRKKSIEEAERAIKNHKKLKMEIVDTRECGKCIKIYPLDFTTQDIAEAVAVRAKGHQAVASIFKRSK